MKPILSIVIANYNYGRFLDDAIQSLISQNVNDWIELVICDAASTDSSVEIIKKYANGLPQNTYYDEWFPRNNSQLSNQRSQLITWWCSEKDGGQSAAFNKGFSHARGRFLTWLNADDVMLPGTVAALKEAISKYPNCEWFVGGCFWLDPDLRIINCGRGRPFSEIRFKSGYVNGYGPSTIFTKRLLDSVGGVDERFHFLMDSELWFRFAKAGARYLPFCNYAWGLRLHPSAKMSAHNFLPNGGIKLGPGLRRTEQERQQEDQVDRERKWMIEGFKIVGMTTLRRIISISWKQVIAARLDLMRFRGKHYLDYFK